MGTTFSIPTLAQLRTIKDSWLFKDVGVRLTVQGLAFLVALGIGIGRRLTYTPCGNMESQDVLYKEDCMVKGRSPCEVLGEAMLQGSGLQGFRDDIQEASLHQRYSDI